MNTAKNEENPDFSNSVVAEETGLSETDTSQTLQSNDNDVGAQEEGAGVSVPTAKKIKRKFSLKKFNRGVKNFFEMLGVPDMLLTRFIAVYFLFSGMNVAEQRKNDIYAIGKWKEFVPEIKIGKTLVLMGCVFVILTVFYSALPKKFKVLDPVLAVSAVIYFDITALWKLGDFYMCMGVMLVSMVFIYYSLTKLKGRKFLGRIHWSICGIIVLALSVMVGTFIAVTTVYKHKIFGTSCFDFGIFVQMYHSLAENLTAVTTCERDESLSHFYIHSSFIYYLLLPFYKAFPKEETLLIAQAVLAMGGIIPVFLIAKRRKFSGVPLIFVCLSYVFCSAVIGPCFYDFHENAFLPTLLMWLLWSIDSRKYIPMYIFSILVSIVKEDAPLYVVCIGMYFFFREKGYWRRLNGLIIAGLSGTYMIIVTKWLTENGDGKFMTSTRFGNLLIDPDGGFAEIVKNVLVDPSYFFNLLIKEHTITFFVQIMLPLLFMPFFTKKIHRFLLILPFTITNLVVGAGYGYAANIGYQYIFGPVCLLIYMSIINLDDLDGFRKNNLPIVMGSASLMISTAMFTGHLGHIESYRNSEEYFTQLEEMLDRVPQEASVAVDTFILPHIADRDEVYIFDSGDFDSYIIDENGEKSYSFDANNPDTKVINDLKDPDRYDFFICTPSFYEERCKDYFEEHQYVLFDEIPGRMRVYKNSSYNG